MWNGFLGIKFVKCLSAFAVIVVFGALLFPGEAHAYLDPGTGSLIIQIIAGAFLALIMTFKMWWYSLKKIVSRLFGSAEEVAADSVEKDAE